MTFFDTNVLVYFTIVQDEQKFDLARQYIAEAIEQDHLMISPMVMSEYIFVLSRFKIEKQHRDKIDYFSQFLHASIDKTVTLQAWELCQQINFCRNINDAIHLKTAEAHCDKLVTFDRDFKRFIPHTSLEIEILN